MSISSVSILVKASLLLLIYIPSLVFASSLQNGDAEKINRYANLTHAVLYEWNYPSELSNEDILQQLKQSKIQSDESDISVVFRHVIALSNAQHVDAPKVPVVIKEVLLDRHWQALKRANLSIYATLRGCYIYLKGMNDFKGSLKRINTTLPALYDLKQQMIQTGSSKAVAIASTWLASEYAESSPIQAIKEHEYALPHLPVEQFDNMLEKEFSQQDVHYLLAESYLDLNLPSKAVFHAQKLFSLKEKLGSLDIDDLTLMITTLNRLQRFTEALELIDKYWAHA